MATPKWHRIEEFCGGKFWDDTLLANASLPDFTVCFQHTVFVWLPCAFLFITAPILLFYSCKSKSLALPWTWLNMIKTAIALLLILVTSAQLFYAVHKWNQGSLPPVVYSVDLVYPLLLCIAMLILMLLSLICKAKGLITSGVIFLSWFCFAACGLVEFITKIKRVSEGPLTQSDDIFYITTFFIYYVCILAEVLLNSFADRRSSYYDVGQENPCPEYLSSFLSQLTFSWFTPLALAGWRRPLEKKDLWNLNECDSSRSVVKRWESYWVPVMQEYTKKRDAACEKQRIEFKLKEEEVKIVDGKQSKHLPAAPSVIWRICLCFKWLFLPATLYKLIADIIQFVSPQLLRMLIQFIQDPAQPVWRGYFYAVSLLLVAVVYSFLLHMYFQNMFKAGMNIRSALVSAIFNKSLRLSNTARKTSTVGEIVNLMSVDAQRYMDVAPFINMLWSCPLQIVVSLYFLWEILGPSVLAGVTVMVLLVPVNGFVATRQKAYQVSQMKFKDDRIKLMNEVLNGMKVLKLYAWETAFEQKLLQIRDKELQVLKSASYLSAFGSFTWICAPFIVAAITFAAYVLSSDENILTPEVAFVSLSLFNILRFPMTMLPMMITMFVQASVSNKRVKEFLVADELDTEFVSHKQTNSDNDVISIEKGTFNWDKDSNVPTLQNIELKVPRGSLVAVVGQVGSGKSSLLSALLGEMESAEGSTVNVVGSIAYCPQQAWIQNAPLRDNVIFGKKFEDADYNRIVDACALRPDFATLPGGDKTEIGEKGINLSGGQKQRVSLARALYQNCDIYLLDDPLSAVDAHVGKHIFDHVVGNKGLLKDKTRILVTHGLSYLKYVDKIVVMKEGKISEAGSYSELLEKRGAFAEFLSTYLLSKEEEEEEEVEEETEEDKVAALLGIRRKRRTTTKSASDDESAVEVPYMNGSVTDGDVKREATKRQISRGMSVTSGVKHQDSVKSKSPTPEKKKAGTTIIETERAEIGRVRSAVYLMYIKALGYLASIVVLFTFAISNAFNVGSSIWLADWSNDVNMTDASNDLRLGVYAGLGIAQGVFIFFGSLLMSYVMVLASEKLHKDLLHNLLRSPLSFYDVTPLGRIVNRVGKDVDIVDNAIPMTVRSWILCVVSVISTLIVIVVGTPVFAVMIIPLGILYFFVQRFYVATSRQLKRMESVTRSPIYSHFQETVSGASSIRAYGVQKRFIYMSEERVDDNQKTYYPNIVSNRWLAIRLEFVGNCVVFFAAVFAVLSRDTINAGLVGLSVSYAMSITQTLNWAVRMTSDLETNIVAVERIKEYSETPTEASWESESDKKPNPNWPKSGQMKFSDYAVRYRPELDPVLRGISCNISGGEKIGIVGRTGAGKSSLTMGLFRIIEADGGKIVIDDIDVSKLGLHDLRSKLTIIPQDPVLFSSSLRFNLDPFGKYSDSELWNALENAHLKSFISSLPDKLEHKITEGGDNLSVGQRQLICLARALLRKTKVLILDEATAAVDLETDDLIQQTIRKEFADCTILTIAHRLNTIMDSTRVMVLDKGRIAELDTVPQLLAHRNSIFHGMAKDAGLL